MVRASNRTPRPALRSQVLDRFVCSGAECPDNCCNGWLVEVDAPTLALYQEQAPDLLAMVKHRDGAGDVLAFDAVTHCCPKLEQGTCTVHATRGTDFLTDTCHLYPRITRALGEVTVVTASMSCPEIARLALFESAPLALVDALVDRVPVALKRYGPETVDVSSALALCEAMWSGMVSPERHLITLATEAFVLSHAPMTQWPTLHDTIQPSLAGALPAPAPHAHDALFMLIVLTTLVTATGTVPSQRLQTIVTLIEQSLHVDVLWDQATANTHADTFARLTGLQQRYEHHYRQQLQPTLSRVLAMQLSSSLYPYAGLGATPLERITWIAYIYALIRLALMCAADQSGGDVPDALVIQVVQTITRVLDHVGTLDRVMPMLSEAGWLDPARLAGLLTPNQM